MVKNLPAMRETRVPSLGWEDPLEKGMATHSSILGLENTMDREAWQAIVHGVTKSQTPLSTHASNYLSEAKNNSLSRRNPLRTQIPTIQQSWVLLGNSQTAGC